MAVCHMWGLSHSLSHICYFKCLTIKLVLKSCVVFFKHSLFKKFVCSTCAISSPNPYITCDKSIVAVALSSAVEGAGGISLPNCT